MHWRQRAAVVLPVGRAQLYGRRSLSAHEAFEFMKQRLLLVLPLVVNLIATREQMIQQHGIVNRFVTFQLVVQVGFVGGFVVVHQLQVGGQCASIGKIVYINGRFVLRLPFLQKQNSSINAKHCRQF